MDNDKYFLSLLGESSSIKENDTIDVGWDSNKLPWGVLEGTGS